MIHSHLSKEKKEKSSEIVDDIISILVLGAIVWALLHFVFLPDRQVRELHYPDLLAGRPGETDVCYNKGRPNYLEFHGPDGKKDGKHTRQIAGIRSSDPSVVHQAKHHKNGVVVEKQLDEGRDVTLTVVMKDGTQFPVKTYVNPVYGNPSRHPAREGLVTGAIVLAVIIWLCSLPVVII